MTASSKIGVSGGSDSVSDEDLRLARAAADGDEHARRQLLTRLHKRVRTTAHYLANNRFDADDCAQISMVEILLSLKGYKGQSSLEAWSARITIRSSMRHLKSLRRGGPRVSSDDVQIAKSASEPDAECCSGQLSDRIKFHLDRLSDKHREALVMHLVLGHTIPEMAEMIDVKPETIRDRLKVARKKFRKMAERDPALANWSTRGDE